ncbi:MAG TPA: GntR family transcriptional regulator [Tepidisphaeraceae bacterium]|nr:GntR family transcriptional regulator [Tepidisphaeraceae bacterium]
MRKSANAADARRPRHREVFETILGDITSGLFQPGDRLPTEAALAKTFSASRTTIARAMRDLKRKGLVNRQRGAGTHIAMQQEKHVALLAPFTRDPSDLGWIGGQIHAHLSALAAHRQDHLRLQIVTSAAGNRLEQMMNAARALINQGIAGVFYYPVELPQNEAHYNQMVVDKLLSAGMAVICVDRDIVSFPDRSRLPLVTYDNRRGGYLVTDHLIKQGRRRIAFIGSPFVSSAASDRLRGYSDALEDNGLPVDKSLIRPAALEDLDAAFSQSLMNDCKPDAVVCKMDHYAALVGRHLMGMGLTIGKDILLAGFDDDPLARLLPVPLTTIRFVPGPFAKTCYERLMAQMAEPSEPLAGMTLIDVELIVRESTAPATAVS